MCKIGFLFPGLGSQRMGMGKNFYDRYRIVQEVFDEASNCIGLNFVKLCFASSEKELAKPMNGYLSLLVVHAALFEVLRLHEIEPTLITGWGIGLVSSHYAAGILNFPDSLYILKKYVTFFTELARKHKPAIINIRDIDRDVLEGYMQEDGVKGEVVIAIIRNINDFVVIGAEPAIKKLCSVLYDNHQGRIYNESLPWGTHRLFNYDVVKQLNVYLEKIDCKAPNLTVINQGGLKLNIGNKIKKIDLTTCLYEPIDIPKVVLQMEPCDILVQIGPGNLDIFKALFPKKRVLPFSQRIHLKELENEKRS